jgi:hypothetical protein
LRCGVWSSFFGLQTGAGIFESRVIVPLWASSPPTSVRAFFEQPQRPDSGRRLWIILSPITLLVTLVNAGVAVVSVETNRTWWLISVACAFVVMVATFAYFVPMLLSFARAGTLGDARLQSKVRMWVVLNYLRAALLIVAWLAALKVFSMLSHGGAGA